MFLQRHFWKFAIFKIMAKEGAQFLFIAAEIRTDTGT